MSGGRFLARWSRLKRGGEPAQAAAAEPVAAPPASPSATEAAPPPAAAETAALPAPESLTLESDFTAYLKAEVGEAVRRQALKKLFNDPHFNVMDGLDIYIDDYSVAAPIPPDVLAKLRHAQELLMEHGGAEQEQEPAAAEAFGSEVAAASVGAEAAGDGAGAVEGGAEAEAPETLAARDPGSQKDWTD